MTTILNSFLIIGLLVGSMVVLLGIMKLASIMFKNMATLGVGAAAMVAAGVLLLGIGAVANIFANQFKAVSFNSVLEVVKGIGAFMIGIAGFMVTLLAFGALFMAASPIIAPMVVGLAAIVVLSGALIGVSYMIKWFMSVFKGIDLSGISVIMAGIQEFMISMLISLGSIMGMGMMSMYGGTAIVAGLMTLVLSATVMGRVFNIFQPAMAAMQGISFSS